MPRSQHVLRPALTLSLVIVVMTSARGGEPARDLVFLAEDRPVFLRLNITIGDRPLDDAWPDSVRALYACLDRDGDGKLSAKEADGPTLAALVRFAAGGPEPDARPKDKGDVASLDALAEALRPALGPFRVVVGRLATGRTDALFDHLDRDKDGQLTRSELAAIAGSLRRLDLDDNEMIGAEELEPFNNPAAAARAEVATERRARFAALPPVVEIAPGESSLRLARLLLRKYDKGKADSDADSPGRPDGKLSPGEFAIDPGAFAAADKNGDGTLAAEELRRYLAGAPVDLVLDVAFPKNDAGRATVRPVGALPKGAQVRQLADGDIELAAGRVRLDIHVDGGESAAADARRVLMRRFKTADVNKNGYLEGKELTGENTPNSPLAGLTGVIDRDGDGKLYEKELTAFLDRQAEAARGRVVLSASDQGRAIFGIVDSDRDRRLGAREVLRTVDRVTSWDGDGDGRVAADEVPYHILVTLARGGLPVSGPATPAAAGASPSATAPAPAAGPDWFRKMDRNRDGDVSRREFLGPREAFERLDRDKDGLIDPEEAAAAKPVGSR